MKAIKDIQRKIDQKAEEIQRLTQELARAESYLEALQETLKIVEKEVGGNGGGTTIRPGSMVDKVRKALLEAGEPLHIETLLSRIGRDVNKRNRASLAGSLGNYVRDRIVFTRPQPATFGLIEFDYTSEKEGEPPTDFGL